MGQIKLGDNFVTEPERQVPISAEYDIVVVGGGTAGVVAAIAAARTGARTALVERYGFLGGCLIGGATGVHSFYNVFKKEPRTEPLHCIKGLPQEIIDRLTAAGGGLGHVEMIEGYDFVSMLTPCEPEIFKSVAFDMCQEAGVKLLMHSFLVDGFNIDGLARGLVIESKSGRECILAKRIVDCTGDGDAAAFLGAPYTVPGKDGEGYYGVALTFRVCNVDLDRAAEFVKSKGARTQWATAVKYGGSRETTVRLGANFTAWDSGWEVTGTRGWLLATGIRDNDMTYLNCTGYPYIDALNRDQLSDAEQALRKQVVLMGEFLRSKIGGFEDCHVAATSAQVGVRRTRIVTCQYDMPRQAVLEGWGFPDEIARYGFVDNRNYFVKDNGTYGMPYRSLVPQKIDNLLVAGRMVTSDHIAHNSTRNTGLSMACGEAAGTAAGLSLELGVSTARLDPQALSE
jgi:hypothetical protein